MRRLILTVALLIPASSPAVGPQAPAETKAPAAQAPGTQPMAGLGTGICTRPDLLPAQEAGALRAKPRGELPPGELRLAVMREIDGCQEPVIVRYGFGGKQVGPPQEAPGVRPRAKLHR